MINIQSEQFQVKVHVTFGETLRRGEFNSENSVITTLKRVISSQHSEELYNKKTNKKAGSRRKVRVEEGRIGAAC